MRVLWTLEAQQDRLDIWDYIAVDSPQAASKMDELFSDAAAQLAQYPMFGRTGKAANTREVIVHENYRLVYELKNEIVWILVLTHVAQRWPK